MKSLIIIGCLFLFHNCSFAQEQHITVKESSVPVKIKWTSHLHGDFSFRNKWSYPEGIEVNEFGQLSCAGFCEPEAAAMIDSTGKIFEDSLTAFYAIVDTSHQFYTISCDAWCYEWGGTDFIEVVRKSTDHVYCSTLLNVATHCSLQLDIVDDNCFAMIDLNSIVKGGSAQYDAFKGSIRIDKILWRQGIMKAVFDFQFTNREHPQKPIYWKGKIYAAIK